MEYIVNFMQLAGGIILALGYVPQIKKIVKTKSVKDFSVQYLLYMTIGILFMQVYAIYNVLKGEALMFLVTNSIALVMAMIMLSLYVKYADNKDEE